MIISYPSIFSRTVSNVILWRPRVCLCVRVSVRVWERGEMKETEKTWSFWRNIWIYRYIHICNGYMNIFTYEYEYMNSNLNLSYSIELGDGMINLHVTLCLFQRQSVVEERRWSDEAPLMKITTINKNH